MFVSNLLPYHFATGRFSAQSYRVRYNHEPKYRQWPDGNGQKAVVEVDAMPQASGRRDERNVEVDSIDSVQKGLVHRGVRDVCHGGKLRGQQFA